MKRSALTALLLAALAAPPVSAQEEGVFVDPDSPAGTEYAVPLEQARREAADARAASSGKRSDAQPLFGIGIGRPPESRGGGEPAQAGTGSGDRHGAPEAGADSSGASQLAPSGQSAAAIEAAASDGSGGLLAAGIAAGVLAAGLLGGLGLRRLLRES